jgi:eukaryotic-like serine/threonine-protein kinase
MRLEPNSYVSPHVRLVRLLRMGGMGSVWTAYHHTLERDVAVKFMSASLMSDPTLVTRFNREGTFTARIKSPHVVEVHEQGLTRDGIPYIVMELLQGEDLSERVARAGPLSLDEMGIIVTQICEALTAAHERGIIHRDIKLDNIFVLKTDGSLFVKLLDFAVAKSDEVETSFVTATGAVLGTLVYMSPEQFDNPKTVDGRTDLWSLAVVAYRALTGEHPFRDDCGVEALLASVRSGNFRLPSDLCAGIPCGVDAWFKKALCQDPVQRFATARELAEELNRAISEQPRNTPRGEAS